MVLAVTLALLSTAFAASPEKVIHSFGIGAANQPWAGLVADAAGNLYGTATGFACPPFCGAVFELSPQGTGFRYTTLHVFKSRNGDGTHPYGELLLDSVGNLFGTTRFGGSTGSGVVFELSPSQTGWSYSVLYNFTGTPSGNSQPTGSLAMDTAGNLYGTTNNGLAYELSPSPAGWTQEIIYTFGAFNGDGNQPQAGMIFDAAGNLYGTTLGGGVQSCYDGCGTVFKLSQQGGVWTETQLYLFQGYPSDGGNPIGNLVFDGAGNLFGTTQFGGGSTACNSGIGCGTAFKLTPSGGTWTEALIHTFAGIPDGVYPNRIVLDGKGNLFGTTYEGGTQNGCLGIYNCGTVYELSPTGSNWTETRLHNFQAGNNTSDGGNPLGGVIFGPSGNLYGTTLDGGVHSGEGTVFVVKP
jgi:uncharacterized repeat protein (TIGR03803 family)